MKKMLNVCFEKCSFEKKSSIFCQKVEKQLRERVKYIHTTYLNHANITFVEFIRTEKRLRKNPNYKKKKEQENLKLRILNI